MTPEEAFMQAIRGGLLHRLTTIILTIGTPGGVSICACNKASCAERPRVANVVIVLADDKE